MELYRVSWRLLPCSSCAMEVLARSRSTVHALMHTHMHIHTHTCACPCRYDLRVRLYRPRSASLLQTFLSWVTGMPAEFADHKFPSYGPGREGGWLHGLMLRCAAAVHIG